MKPKCGTRKNRGEAGGVTHKLHSHDEGPDGPRKGPSLLTDQTTSGVARCTLLTLQSPKRRKRACIQEKTDMPLTLQVG